MEARKEKLSLNPIQHIAQLLKWLLLVAIVSACAFSFNELKQSHYFYIRNVRVYGLNHVSQQQIKSILIPLVNHGFFTLNIEDIKDRLQQIPWVGDITVTKQWPNQVEISIIEKAPLANWNGTALLSDNGEIFTPSPETSPQNLPQFVGPQGQQILMLNYFKQINRILNPLHVTISALELTSYLTWKLTLNNGIKIELGHKDILDRLAQFVGVYPKIVGERASDVDYIDLRYPNGVAVRWKQLPKPQPM